VQPTATCSFPSHAIWPRDDGRPSLIQLRSRQLRRLPHPEAGQPTPEEHRRRTGGDHQVRQLLGRDLDREAEGRSSDLSETTGFHPTETCHRGKLRAPTRFHPKPSSYQATRYRRRWLAHSDLVWSCSDVKRLDRGIGVLVRASSIRPKQAGKATERPVDGTPDQSAMPVRGQRGDPQGRYR